MPTYFLDTTVLIAYFMNEDPKSEAIIEEVLQGRASGVISAITVLESLVADQTRDPAILASRKEVLAAMAVVPLDRDIAERAAELRRDFQLGLGNAAIAATGIKLAAPFYSKDPDYGRLFRAGRLHGDLYR